MKELKVVEIYSSIQGEGPHVGRPITFVRFGGCNLRCPGWGYGKLPDGNLVQGCDTVFAVDPKWRNHWRPTSVDDILRDIPQTPERICLTGGEPLIQPAGKLGELVGRYLERGSTYIDLFTNGSQLLPDWTAHNRVAVVMDYKLPGSGEYGSFNTGNWSLLIPYKDVIKFVCKDEYDVEVALNTYNDMMRSDSRRLQAYFGVVWDQEALTEGELAEMVVEYAPEAILNVQMHNHLWPANERRR
jgi:7-carboxy-7-deazaguanine synthase